MCVIGLGRIGLPIALVTAKRGYTVYGVDIDPGLVKDLGKGRVRFREPGLEQLLSSCRHRFRATADLKEAISNSNVILCCVGTRRFFKRKPNLNLLWRIFEDLASVDISGRLIILKTTVPLGTTRKLAHYLEEKTCLKVDRDFFMAFSPERTVEGKAVLELQTLPVVVGGVADQSSKRAVDFYKATGADVVNVVTAEAAELVKMIDNAYRITKFAFSNDISFVAEKIGLNVFEIIDAANYRYPRNDIPYPTCGVSGYCLSKDPYYLEEAFDQVAKERGFASLWMTARRSYDFRVKQLVAQIEQSLGSGDTKTKKRALVCGVAFKSNIDDVRDSHGLAIARELTKRGMLVSIWDPWVVSNPVGYRSCKNATDAFKGKDVAVFTVAHSQFKRAVNSMRRLSSLMRTPLIYDGAGLFRGRWGLNAPYDLIGTGLPRKAGAVPKKHRREHSD